MSFLLQIPRELRDHIIELSLFSSPILRDDVTRRVDEQPELWFQEVYMLDSERPTQPTAIPLLLVNHQLHEETTSVLDRIKPCHQLDIAVINDTWVWPTWRYIPSKSTSCENILQTEIILCYTEEALCSGPREDWKPHLAVIKSIWSYLKRSLESGAIGDVQPRTYPERKSRAYPHILGTGMPQIEELQINIESASLQRGALISEHRVPGRLVEDKMNDNCSRKFEPVFDSGQDHTRRFAQEFSSSLDRRMRTMEYKVDRMPFTLFRHISRFIICLDGERLLVLDIVDLWNNVLKQHEKDNLRRRWDSYPGLKGVQS